jgi:soluble lytic murein transglycosylase
MTPRAFAVFLALLIAAPAWAGRGDDELRDRRDYQAALSALRLGQLAQFQALRKKLDGYILAPYLDYELLKDRVVETPRPVLHAYLENNEAAAVSGQLRARWLKSLADRGEWDSFLAEYRPLDNETELACRRLTQLLRKQPGRLDVQREAEQLWQNGNRLPAACDTTFELWRQAGYMTDEQVFERVRLAMERRNLSLAERLGQYLAPRERVWVDRWLAMHRDPARELATLRYPVETPVARAIVRHGVVRLAYNDPDVAMQEWARLRTLHSFFGEDDSYVLRWVGLLAAQAHHPRAAGWLAAVSAGGDDESLRHWRVRAAIRHGTPASGLRAIAQLNESERQEGEWRYWRARLLEENGEKREAERLYGELARERSYYGFMAADRTGRPYALQHVAVEPTPEEIGALLANPGVAMARELFMIGDTVAARRQWSWTIRTLTPRELAVAAVLAQQWGWHDRAIFTVNRSDHLDDLELRFPVLYRDLVEQSAQQANIEPDWVYGVMRQESAFVTDARSSAGALGLMQLMPQTGRLTGRLIKLPVHSNEAILKVENNLRLGTSYLRQVLNGYQGNQVLATAAYNAGPARVKVWLPNDKLPADRWVDTIPFNETRQYVKNVLAFTTVYGHRLGTPTRRMTDRMPAVGLRDAGAEVNTLP